MTKSTLTTSLTCPVDLRWEILPADLYHGLPEQIEITEVLLTIKGPTGRRRKINLVHIVDEATMMAFEDEIEILIRENLNEN